MPLNSASAESGRGQESTKKRETDYRNKEKQIGGNRIIRQGETEYQEETRRMGKIDHREKKKRKWNRGKEKTEMEVSRLFVSSPKRTPV